MKTLKRLDSSVRWNDEQVNWVLISITLQISGTHDGATPSKHAPYIIWDSSGNVPFFLENMILEGSVETVFTGELSQ